MPAQQVTEVDPGILEPHAPRIAPAPAGGAAAGKPPPKPPAPISRVRS